MDFPKALKGVVVISHGADLAGAQLALLEAGVSLRTQASGLADEVHLIPYGEALAVIIDPDAPPIEWLGYPLNPNWLLAAIRTGADLLNAKRAVRETHVLLAICRAMASERDVNALHRFILRKARELTNADAGSLYLLEEHDGQLVLRFAVAQTGPHDEETYVGRFLALSEQSVAGSVALRGAAVRVGDVYAELPSSLHFDSSFDTANDYHTKSMICAPIRNFRDEIVGVVQLVNRKPTFEVVLNTRTLVDQLVTPFDDRDEEVLMALAAQAGVALENSRRAGTS